MGEEISWLKQPSNWRLLVQLYARFVLSDSTNGYMHFRSVLILFGPQVFTVLALCPHEPIPMTVFCRLLGVEPGSNSEEIQTIRECDLLITRKEDSLDSNDGLEKVFINRRTRKSFRTVFIDSGKILLMVLGWCVSIGRVWLLFTH